MLVVEKITVSSIESLRENPHDLFRAIWPWITSRRWFGEGEIRENHPAKVLYVGRSSIQARDSTCPLFWFFLSQQESKDERQTDKVVPIILVDPDQVSSSSPFMSNALLLSDRDGKILAGEPEYWSTYWYHIFAQFPLSEDREFSLHNFPLTFSVYTSVGDNPLAGLKGPDSIEVEILGGGDTTNVVLKLSFPHTSVVVKGYREARQESREIRVGEFLSRIGFRNVPRFYGSVKANGNPGFFFVYTFLEAVSLKADAGNLLWHHLVDWLAPENTTPNSGDDSYLGSKIQTHLEKISSVVAGFHRALRSGQEDPFVARPFTHEDIKSWLNQLEPYLHEVRKFLSRQVEGMGTPENTQKSATSRGMVTIYQHILDRLPKELDESFFTRLEGLPAQVIHEDMHFGQILQTGSSEDDRDFVILDLEGDPEVPFSGSFTRHPVTKDLAGLVRALSYIKIHAVAQRFTSQKIEGEQAACIAAVFILAEQDILQPESVSQDSIDLIGLSRESAFNVVALANRWEEFARQKLLSAYQNRDTKMDLTRDKVLPFLFERALKEVYYELKYRPERAITPASGLLEILTVFPAGTEGDRLP